MFRDYDASIGRYNKSDPIGLVGGVNTYTYAGSTPTSMVDPFGLTEWHGTFNIRSASVLVGATVAEFDLTSECVDGKQMNVQVTVTGPMVGAGLKFIFGGQTRGDITFTDHAEDIDFTRLEGTAGVLSAGVQVGTLGFGVNKIRLGSAYSRGTQNSKGLDIGISAAMGSSTVTGGKGEIACECE